MFRSVVLGSNDIERAKKFYDATMGVMGFPPSDISESGAIAYRGDGPGLIVTRPRDGNPATVANGGTIGFDLESAEQVRAWHEAGLNAGGTAIEDPPGIRTYPARTYYSAYLRDPDGNKLAALFLLPA